MVRVLAIALVMVACSRASDEGDTKQWQTPPPPPEVVVPAALSIAVDVDGATKSPVTTAMLQQLKPDFADVDRRAWLIQTLIADAAQPDTFVEASAPGGVSVKFQSHSPDGLEPVLFLTRRGEIIVSAIDPKDPFPRFHGQGGRLH